MEFALLSRYCIGMRIVLIDPAAFQRRILALLLESRGLSPTEQHASRDEVSGDFSAEDLVLVDAASFADTFAPARVIATGSEKSDSQIADALRRGADGFLAKPFTEEGLASALAELTMTRDALAGRAA